MSGAGIARRLRSVLFAPANDRRKVARLAELAADAVVLDLEDALPREQLGAGRRHAAETVPSLSERTTALVCVRVNQPGGPEITDDLAAVVGPGLGAIVLPKVGASEDLWRIDARLADLERSTGLPLGCVGLLPMIETAHAVLSAEAILRQAPERVLTCMFGSGDFEIELGVTDRASPTTDVARATVVMATAAAGLAPPVDGPCLSIDDLDTLEASTRRSRSAGFQGRIVIHPSQVEPVNRIMSDDALGEASLAGEIVEAYEQAVARGSGAVRVRDRLVDYPTYRQAKDLLDDRPPA